MCKKFHEMCRLIPAKLQGVPFLKRKEGIIPGNGWRITIEKGEIII
jgi:hypothetical protein